MSTPLQPYELLLVENVGRIDEAKSVVRFTANEARTIRLLCSERPRVGMEIHCVLYDEPQTITHVDPVMAFTGIVGWDVSISPTSSVAERRFNVPDLSDHHRELRRELDRDALERRLSDKLSHEWATGKRKYPTTVFRADGYYRVPHSPQEHAALLVGGWVDTRTPGQQYRASAGAEPQSIPDRTTVAPGGSQTPTEIDRRVLDETLKIKRGQSIAAAQARWRPVMKRTVPFRWIHIAAGVDHKDAYNWKNGKLPETSIMAKNIERVLQQPKPPAAPVAE